MKTARVTIAAMLIAGSTAIALASGASAQGTSKAAGGVTAAAPGQPSHPASSAGASGSDTPRRTIVPRPHGNSSANVGNTSESNGILGSHGAQGDTNAQGRYQEVR